MKENSVVLLSRGADVALKLFTAPKQPLSVTGVNLTSYPFLYGWGCVGSDRVVRVYIEVLCGICKGCVDMCRKCGACVRGGYMQYMLCVRMY